MGTSPRISVITPVYNVAPYLAEAVASVLDQRFPDFEYLLVDDGSLDGSAELAQQLTASHPRLSCFSIPHSGSYAARNFGLTQARGEFVAFLDGDDSWHPDFLAEMLSALEAAGPNCAYAFSWSEHVSDSGSSLGKFHRPRPGAYSKLETLKAICPPGNGSSLLIRRSALTPAQGFLPFLLSGGDMEMWIRILAETPSAFSLCVPKVLVQYRYFRPGSLSSRLLPTRMKAFEFINARYTRNLSRLDRATIYLNQACHARTLAQKWYAFKFFVDALIAHPRSVLAQKRVWRGSFSFLRRWLWN